MAESSSEEKTEAPTQKKRDDARKEGQVAFSKEASTALLLGAYIGLFYLSGPWMLESYSKMIKSAFQNIHLSELTIPLIENLFTAHFNNAAKIVIPFFATALIVGVMISVAQVGFHVTGKPLIPKFEKMNPLKGLQRWFSKQAFSELFKSLFKMVLIGYIGYDTFAENEQIMHNLMDQDAQVLMFTSFDLIGTFAIRLFMALMVLAFLDVMFQRYDLEQKLKMSKQEVKEEYKQSEGDPKIKARIRQVQQEMSQARMMQEVPKADVVITNPTHFAIAMRYDKEIMAAPQVIAKGADHLARRMIEIAKENDVIIYENPPVARGCYFQVEVGDAVPEEFYRAVAEILAFVYKKKKKI